MAWIRDDQEGVVEERLLTLTRADLMLDPILVCVTLVPLESGTGREHFHGRGHTPCILQIYTTVKRRGRRNRDA
jgi:hypothetical protein